MKEQLRELIEKYDPALFWFDGEWTSSWTREKGEALYKYLRVLKPDLVINDRVVKKQFLAHGDGDYDTTAERQAPHAEVLDWENSQTMNDTWGFKTSDTNWKPTSQYLEELVNVTSQDGNYLLNIGPDGTGVIPTASLTRLQAVGDWLAIHGPAIYGTDKPNPLRYIRPSWGWYATKGTTVYAIVKDWPTNGQLELEYLDSQVTRVTSLSSPGTTYGVRGLGEQLFVTGLPTAAPNSHLSVLELSIAGAVRGRPNFALNRPVTVSDIWQSDAAYNGAKAVDGNDATRWATNDGVTTATLTVTLDGSQTFNRIVIKEPDWAQRVTGYTLEYWNGTAWTNLHTGTAIGTNASITFTAVSSNSVRLSITGASDPPTISEFQVRNSPNEPESLAYNRPVTVSDIWQSDAAYNGAKAVDGNDATRWATNDGVTTATLTVTLDGSQTFNRIVIKEPDWAQRVTGYTLEYWNGTAWTNLHTGTAIGTNASITFTAVSSNSVRLSITGASDPPTISEFQVQNDVIWASVSFGSATYSAAEGSTVSVTVKLSADPEGTVVIPITATDLGGATASDYSGVPAGVTFNSGETSKSFTFTAAADTVDDASEIGESVQLAFGALPAGVAAGTPATSVVSINDVSVSFGSATYSAAEGSTVSVTVKLSADPERTVVIPITATDLGGATASDYSGVPAGVTFNSGETSKSFTFTAVDDTVDDDGESVQLEFGTLPAGITAGNPATATVSIDDNEVSVSFGSATYSAAEGSTVSVTVKLSADPERTVVIPITAINLGGATASDYSGVPASVTFNSGETSKSFTFTAAADTVDDDGESVQLEFGTPPAGVAASTGEARATTVVSLTDDDAAPSGITLSVSPDTLAEDAAASARTVTVTAAVTGGTRFATAKTVAVSVVGSGTPSAVDFAAVPSFEIVIAAETTSKTGTFTLTPTDDNVDETDETITVSGELTGVTVTADTLTLTDDDDTPTVTLSVSPDTLAEDAAVSARTVTVTAAVTGGTRFATAKTVAVSVVGSGTPSAVDFAAVPDFEIVIAAETTSKTGTFTLTPTDDNVDETDETITVSGELTGVTVTADTLTLTDDDATPTNISLSVNPSTVAEDAAASARTITVTATVTGGTTFSTARTVTVSVAGSGTASAVDFAAVSDFDVTIAAGAASGSGTFMLTPVNDNVDETTETITISGALAGVTVSSTSMTLTDDDATPTNISLSVNPTTVPRTPPRRIGRSRCARRWPGAPPSGRPRR